MFWCVIYAGLYLFRRIDVSRTYVLLIGAVDFVLLVTGRAVTYSGVSWMRDRLKRYHYLLIVGCGPRAREMAALIEKAGGWGCGVTPNDRLEFAQWRADGQRIDCSGDWHDSRRIDSTTCRLTLDISGVPLHIVVTPLLAQAVNTARLYRLEVHHEVLAVFILGKFGSMELSSAMML